MAEVPDLRWAPPLRAALRPLFRTIARIEVEGSERIPRRGACILAFNHLSNLDPHLLFTLMPRRDAAGLVAAEYREFRVVRWLVEAGGGIWIRRGVGDRGALARALALLERGWLVGLAPEGRRSRDGTLQRGRRGVGFLAVRSGAPVLPVAVTGTNHVGRALRRGRRGLVRVRVGEPIPTPRSHPGGPGALSREVRDRTMEALAALLPDAIRGPRPPILPTMEADR